MNILGPDASIKPDLMYQMISPPPRVYQYTRQYVAFKEEMYEQCAIEKNC